jgi:hypothetical protein
VSILFYKDEILDRLAEKGNIAQFVSFSPELVQRNSRIAGVKVNYEFGSPREAIEKLFLASPEGSLNVRSFLPDQPQSHEFVYGIKNQKEVCEHVERLASQGLYTIVNETIDVNDGGVSGVLQNGVVEFAPGVVPRFVEKSADPVSTLPKEFAIRLLEEVYSCTLDIDYPSNMRVEFSLHPRKRGWRKTNTIIWEEEVVEENSIEPFFRWPTGFSKFIGDKAYGLLIAHLLGFPVPKSTVFSTNPVLGIFSFGNTTGTGEVWMRTCPIVQEPGLFTTVRGWSDPYALMASDDPKSVSIASCLAQQEVPALFSGALLSTADEVLVEGVKGFGDDFMIGKKAPASLPKEIVHDVKELYRKMKEVLGPIRMEWAHDGSQVWVLQLHVGVSESSTRIIYPGNTTNNVDFFISDGLDALRTLVKNIGSDMGILVHGNIGMSSHIADVLRKAKIPSFVVD